MFPGGFLGLASCFCQFQLCSSDSRGSPLPLQSGWLLLQFSTMALVLLSMHCHRGIGFCCTSVHCHCSVVFVKPLPSRVVFDLMSMILWIHISPIELIQPQGHWVLLHCLDLQKPWVSTDESLSFNIISIRLALPQWLWVLLSFRTLLVVLLGLQNCPPHFKFSLQRFSGLISVLACASAEITGLSNGSVELVVGSQWLPLAGIGFAWKQLVFVSPLYNNYKRMDRGTMLRGLWNWSHLCNLLETSGLFKGQAIAALL